MRVTLAAGLLLAASASPALAQYADPISATVEVASDERRRGLSWSDGDPVVRGSIVAQATNELSFDAAATSLWGSDRHGDADAVVDIGTSYARQLGAWRLSARGVYHLFPGASGQGYGEVGAGAAFLIGPANIDLNASYAPKQVSIGGDNLYLSASASAGIPGTPLTVSAHVGRSSGSVRDREKAARLRPDGTYWDHGISVEYLKRQWFAGLRYANSSIDGTRHSGATLIGRAGIAF
ncbi:MAG TPA: TorF family putative porin [Sphingobium sp.]|nr:TorF family putative porin [Sphingobium sp.]